jgi:16S rRNA processing protein RimM
MHRSSPEDFRAIGVVIAAHGLQGTLKIESWSDFPERFSALKRVYLKTTVGELSEHRMKDVRLGPRHVLLKLADLTRREQAEDYRGAEVLVPDDESWPLPPNRYYISDLVGIEAIGTDDIVLGTVTDVAVGGAQDILIVEGPFGELMIPLVDQWVVEVSVLTRKVRIANWKDLVNPEECKDAD